MRSTWARECVRRGAGELLITSIDRDGARMGYDLELTAAIAEAVDVPVVASGGAGSASDVCDALVRGRADAALGRRHPARRGHNRAAHQGRNGPSGHTGARSMSAVRNETLLQAVSEAARLTGRVALAHFRTRLDVETKRDGSPVTIADRAAEQTAREWIAARFPDDAILGEEFGPQGDEAARRWIIDPIDGTKTFVRGVPLWGTLIGVASGEHRARGSSLLPGGRRDRRRCCGRGLLVERRTVSRFGARRDRRLDAAHYRYPVRGISRQSGRGGRRSQTRRQSRGHGAIATAI